MKGRESVTTKHTAQFSDSLFKITDNGLYSIEMIFPEKKLSMGVNTVDIIIHDEEDRDVLDANIVVTPWMPEMGHGVTEKPFVNEKGYGLYSIRNIVLVMTGHWELKVKVNKNGSEDTLVFNFPNVPSEAGNKLDLRSVLKALPASPPVPADNPMTVEKINLGKMLYWDRRVSKTGATSCVFCHYPSYYGAEPMRKSVGINGDIHLRNAQTVLNSAFLTTQFWASESPTLEHQALAAIRSHVATRSWPNEVAERLNRLPEYRKLSMKVFGGPLTEENIGKAIAGLCADTGDT